MKKSGKQVNYLFNIGLPIVENFKESEFKFLFNKKKCTLQSFNFSVFKHNYNGK